MPAMRPFDQATRRQWLKALALALPALGGCGFRWRGQHDLAFERIALTGFSSRSTMGRALREAVQRQGKARVVDVAQAQVVLNALTEQREKTVVASTASGLVRELELRVRFRFSLSSAQDQELLQPSELLQTRLLSYQEKDALAKEQEELELYRAMEADIIQQVMRRLSALRGSL